MTLSRGTRDSLLERLKVPSWLTMCAVSLAVRLVAWWLVAANDVPVLYDETDYFALAVAWREACLAFLRLELPSAHVLGSAYGSGGWPPLHPLVLGLGMVVGGPAVATARLVMVVLSALTTFVIYRLANDLFDRRVAIAAGWMHALYPTFIAYSHFLWSETTYLLLLATAVWLVARARTSPSDRERHINAVAAGVALGAACLTRATGLPYLLFIPAWLAYELHRKHVSVAAARSLVIAGVIVILPWLLVLAAQENRPVLLSTQGGYNLALGNNPWVPPGHGSSWGHPASKARLHAALSERDGFSENAPPSSGSLALDEILSRPGTFGIRTLLRLQQLWTVDFFPLRHLFNAVYPPVPPWLAAATALAVLATYLAVLTLSMIGFRGMNSSTSRLMVGLVFAGTLLPAVTVGFSRLHLPIVALLLPAAGRGLVALRDRSRSRREIVAVLAVVSLVVLPSLPSTVAFFLLPSSYYAGVVRLLDRPLGIETTYRDRILVRASEELGELEIRVISADASYADGTRQRRWQPGDQSSLLDLHVISRGHEELALAIAGPEWPAPCRLSPVTPRAWRRWQRCGLEGVSFRWAGGGPFHPGRLREPNGQGERLSQTGRSE